MRLVVGAKSDIGRQREGNEDAFLAEDSLFAVADGMGGHLAGDVASTTAVEVISAKAREVQGPGQIGDLVRAANEAIYTKAQDDPTLRGMGTTCTVLMVDGQKARIAHVGDSRAYMLSDGRLKQLTEDHTLVSRMVSEGRLRPEEAAHHPQRSIITRALGVEADVEVDLSSVDVAAGDRLLLCSDGLSSMVNEAAIGEVLKTERDPQRAADRLVEIANEAGGDDNITVVVVDVSNGESSQREGARSSPRERTDPAGRAKPAHATAWRRKVLIAVAIVSVLVAGTYAVLLYVVNNSWFVGASDEGIVTIYQGIPEEVPGLSLKRERERTDLRVAELPTFLHDDVEAGIKFDSLTAAERAVADLEQRAMDFREESAGGGGKG